MIPINDQLSVRLMLQFAFRYNIGVIKGGAFRDWLIANEVALHEHQPPGWTYLGTWSAVRGFGDFGYESRWELDGYEALGAGSGTTTRRNG